GCGEEPRKRAGMIDAYRAGPPALHAAVRGLGREQLVARPVAGKWSTLEVVCHLADFDPILADRMKRVIAEDRPQLLGADENRFAAALAYHQRDLDEELAVIAQTRGQRARRLRQHGDDGRKRAGGHTDGGERALLRLARLVTVAANHLRRHVKCIREKRQALGLPA